MANPAIGKLPTGMAEKPDDRFAVPLCAWCHRNGLYAQHKMAEGDFWRSNGLDPFAIAARLYAEYGGDGGKVRKRRTKTRVRLPKEKRAKIHSRGFPKKKQKFRSYHAIGRKKR